MEWHDRINKRQQSWYKITNKQAACVSECLAENQQQQKKVKEKTIIAAVLKMLW